MKLNVYGRSKPERVMAIRREMEMECAESLEVFNLRLDYHL